MIKINWRTVAKVLKFTATVSAKLRVSENKEL